MKLLSILGSTGSIGQSALDVVRNNPHKFRVVGLAEGHDINLLSKQIDEFRPQIVSVRNAEEAKKLEQIVGKSAIEIRHGISGACEVASNTDAQMVLSAIVGAAGLRPTVAAIEAGKDIALANKETMVIAGGLICEMAINKKVKIIPVDSEHSAIFQSLVGHRREDIADIILTASGGPFLRWDKDRIAGAKPHDALKHPRWSMGAKITIDSATLMNKGLEVIEARWLFDVAPEKIKVVVHPESIVHSMVEYNDGCVIAELGIPDMRAPIAYALSYPERVKSGVERLDLSRIGSLTFEKPDKERFGALDLSYRALRVGRSMPCVLNAANEVAVAAFLDGKIGFLDITNMVKTVMDSHDAREFSSIDEIIEIDRETREITSELVRQ